MFRTIFKKNEPVTCVSLMRKTKEEILERAEALRADCPDMIEWRIDAYERAADTDDVIAVCRELAVKTGSIPLLATFRTRQEGGVFGGACRTCADKKAALTTDEEAAYLYLLEELCEEPAVAAVDVEAYTKPDLARAVIATAERTGTYIIASCHDFSMTPPAEEIERRMEDLAGLGDIVKTAFMPSCREDVEALKQAGAAFQSRHADVPVILIAMGELGQESRIKAGEFGSCLVYLRDGEGSAPGQLTLEEWRKINSLN